MSNNNEYYSSEHLNCPICEYPMYSFEKSGFFSGGTHFLCKKCGLELTDKKDNRYYIENAPENTKLNKKYKYKTLHWNDLLQIACGNYTWEEKMEISQLIRIEITDEICPVCYEKYLETFRKEGMLSFNSLICPNCNVRFEISNDHVSFIYSRNNFSILWEFYNKKLYLNQIRDILSKYNQEIYQKRIEYEENNPEDFFTETDLETNELENTEKFIEIDINNASITDLLNIQTLNDEQIMKLIRLKDSGVIFYSYEDLSDRLNLTNDELEYVKNELIINELEDNIFNNETNNGHLDEESEEEDNPYKIDINSADLDELTNIPSINLIKAKKIINLRNENNYIKSYDDLKEKLNLNPEQINQIKKRTIISEVNDDLSGRIIDF
ncbi:helix-hairpin-helix domain-containing protein [Methanosphaera sp. ISO3-F5]|uniref:ComEA family DNA-binding protein n=1 Tax=Methanosphaera sp. ISO3-F5 TaxID=1452353 RepID=UPI002B258F7E|nr:helix-hairpin-helix domain-containing protein [Methanosphaera sp. ISO3-F5]WQH63674.1 helix-hairpin-helix domain-containing protein [Methanosphaera sp. ISO3-F5]